MAPLSRLLVAGTGDVVGERLRPAVRKIAEWHPLTSITYFDVTSQPARFQLGNMGIPERFVQIHDCDSAVDQLMSHGALGRDTLLLVYTPSPLHVPYARSFAEFVGRVGVEKPLSLSPSEAATLLDYEQRVCPINHQVWKPDMLRWGADCHFGRCDVQDIGRLEFVLHEQKGVGPRTIDDAIFDLVWHGLECGLVPLIAGGMGFNIYVRQAQTATYINGPDQRHRTTAARVEIVLRTPLRDIPLTISVGKGLERGAKSVVAYDYQDEVLRVVSLNAPNNRGHQLAISELLSASRPFLPVSLQDVVKVVEACSDAAARACEMPHYAFGSTPEWLTLSTPAVVVAA